MSDARSQVLNSATSIREEALGLDMRRQTLLRAKFLDGPLPFGRSDIAILREQPAPREKALRPVKPFAGGIPVETTETARRLRSNGGRDEPQQGCGDPLQELPGMLEIRLAF